MKPTGIPIPNVSFTVPDLSPKPIFEIRPPNDEDKRIADMWRLGFALVNKYPRECVAVLLLGLAFVGFVQTINEG